MSNGNNVPLQLRAGKNYNSILGAFSSYAFDAIKLQNQELVVAEGTDDLSIFEVGASAVSALASAASGFVLNNHTGNVMTPIVAELYYENKYGDSIKVDDATISDGASETLKFDAFMALRKGEKLVLRITGGDILEGNGVTLYRVSVRLDPSFSPRIALSEKVTQDSLWFPKVEGFTPITGFYGIANFSNTSVDVSVVVYGPDGSEIETRANPTLAAQGFFTYPSFLSTGYKAKLQFSALPADGYLYGAPGYLLPANAHIPQPLLW